MRSSMSKKYKNGDRYYIGRENKREQFRVCLISSPSLGKPNGERFVEHFTPNEVKKLKEVIDTYLLDHQKRKGE